MTDQEYNKKLFEDNLPGLSLEEALEWVKEAGYCLRIVRFDGHPSVATRDFRMDRINVDVENGKIKYFRSIG